MIIVFVYNSVVPRLLKLIPFTFEYNLGIYITILCYPYIITATVLKNATNICNPGCQVYIFTMKVIYNCVHDLIKAIL